VIEILPTLVIIVSLIAVIGTIFVGMNPEEKNYAATTKKRMVRLTSIYIISTIILLALLYFFKS
jgi:hypothetical protein